MTKLQEILESADLKNHAIVELFPGTLSHKTVQKARLGTRPISKKAKQKIVDALNQLLEPTEPYSVMNVFPESQEESDQEESEIDC